MVQFPCLCIISPLKGTEGQVHSRNMEKEVFVPAEIDVIKKGIEDINTDDDIITASESTPNRGF